VVIVFGEASLAEPLVALGTTGAWLVHADRGHKVKQILQNLKTGATEVAEVPCPRASAGRVLIRSRVSPAYLTALVYCL
jgi:hypothetical protein